MRRRAVLCGVALLLLLVPAAAQAGERISETKAMKIAAEDPTVAAQREESGPLGSSAQLNDGNWEVAFFAHGDEVALVMVDPHSGEVKEAWTGYQVAWRMARGYEGQFGHKLNAPYVFLPLCAIFLLGLVDWRRRWRIANLDLLVLLGFGVSHYFFNQGEIGVSVPLQYPVLLYLLGRALWIGLRGRGEGLRPVWPLAWLVVGALFLMGFRVGLNLADSGAIDVGYASVVGADRITHGEQLYDNFPDDVSSGDTYGPVNYLAYVPFELVFPWSGSWDDLPAAHAATVTFDVAAFLLLILIGLRIRPGPAGRRLAATLAFGWAAYPYSAFALESNSNDTLLAVLLLATILALARPAARGALAALATWAKFAPALLVPMLATFRPQPAGGAVGGPMSEEALATGGHGGSPAATGPAGWGRTVALFAAAFAAVTIAAMLWPAIDPGLGTFYDRTFGYQNGRDSPFSIWGQASLEPLRTALLVGTAGLALGFAFRPRRKTPLQVTALSAALLIALQLTLHHWFYLYVVWFYPLLLIGMAAVEPAARTAREPAPSPAESSPPVPAG